MRHIIIPGDVVFDSHSIFDVETSVIASTAIMLSFFTEGDSRFRPAQPRCQRYFEEKTLNADLRRLAMTLLMVRYQGWLVLQPTPQHNKNNDMLS